MNKATLTLVGYLSALFTLSALVAGAELPRPRCVVCLECGLESEDATRPLELVRWHREHEALGHINMVVIAALSDDPSHRSGESA